MITRNESKAKTPQKETKNSEFETQARRQRLLILLECSRIYPFTWRKNLYFCLYCDQRFADPAKLRKHSTEHKDMKHTEIKHALNRLKKHEVIKADITDVSCKLCNTPIDRLDDLITHLFKKHEKKIDPKFDVGILPFKINLDSYKCVFCDKKYEEYKSLNHHMNVHYQNFICEQCGSAFVTSERLRIHCFTHETRSIVCDACNKVFRSVHGKNEHYANVHMKVKRHRCPQCPETFRNYFQRSKHVSSIHGMKLKEFKCNLCQKVFTVSGKLGAHVRHAHLKEKPHACDVCRWRFYSMSELKQHMVKHGGERKHQCDICKKAYVRKYSLREHMRIHENERPFVCVCGKSFVHSCSLKHHSKIHHSCSAPKTNAFTGSTQDIIDM